MNIYSCLLIYPPPHLTPLLTHLHIYITKTDYTVWRCYIDSCGGPPFIFHEQDGVVLDRRKWEIELFPHSRSVLQALREMEVKLALASRTEEPDWAREVIKIFQMDEDGVSLLDFTHAQEIYPSSKDKHFNQLASKLGIDFQDMIFFDDESRNIHDVSRLGVTSVHCEDGLCLEALERGLRQFRAARRNGGGGRGEGGGVSGAGR